MNNLLELEYRCKEEHCTYLQQLASPILLASTFLVYTCCSIAVEASGLNRGVYSSV